MVGKAITCEEALANALINEKLIIDPLSRKIYIPENEEFFGVYTDRNSERKYFRCPRIVGNNVDLSTCYIFVNYISAKGEPGQYWCKDADVDDTGDYVDFSWELTGNVFDKNADCEIYFAVSAKKINEAEPVFNTLKAKGRIGETVVAGDYIEEANADVILQILAKLDNIETSGGMSTDSAEVVISETEPTNENTDLWINPSDDEEVNIYTAEEVDEKLSKAGSAEVPIFDLTEMGLPAIPFSLSEKQSVSAVMDTTEIREASTKGSINLKFKVSPAEGVKVDGEGIFNTLNAMGDYQASSLMSTGYGIFLVSFIFGDGNIIASIEPSQENTPALEIPTFDLVEMGLPAVPMIGDGVYINVDTTELRNALSKGVVKGKFNVIYSGNILPYEFISTSCYVAYEDRYICTAVVPSGNQLCFAHVFVETGKISARCDVITVSQ